MVCGHSICFRSNTCGQICAAEPSEKTSIGRADPRRRSRAEQSRADWNNGNKNRKRCDIIADADHWKRTCLATFGQAQHPNWTLNWNLFKAHFNERFEDTQESERVQQLLLNGKLVQTTSVRKFADLVTDTCQKAGWDEPAQWKAILRNGMKKEVASILAPHMLLHWNDYLRLAISTDKELQCLKGKDSTPQRKSTTIGTSTSKDNRNRPNNSKFKLSDDKKKEHVEQGLCFKCHKKGHNLRECKGERTIYREFKSGRAQVANVKTTGKGKEVTPIEDEDFVDGN
jgi:hypothetical protein